MPVSSGGRGAWKMANVAILGFGTVGGGVYDIIKSNAKDKIKANDEGIYVKRILDIRDFPDHEEKEIFTKDFNDILNDESISVVAETMGGLHPAYEFTKSLLESGKSVVTSNKELVATYGTELLELAADKNVNYMFEASVGGGIPVIRPIHQCLTANNVERIAGILNGTTNYILNQMINFGKTFDAALSEAQENGYAEKNPAADIEGHDACRKIAILASLASGKFVDYNNIPTEGITNITLEDVKYAGALGYSVKLIGYMQTVDDKLGMFVAPMFVPKSCPLAGVDDVFNAIMIKGDCVGDVMFYGRGAGKLPTASAVVADVIDSVKHYERSKKISWIETKENIMYPSEDLSFSYFVRVKGGIPQGFESVSEVCDIVSGETGFITPVMTESEIKEKTAGNNSIVSVIKVLE